MEEEEKMYVCFYKKEKKKKRNVPVQPIALPCSVVIRLSKKKLERRGTTTRAEKEESQWFY